MASAWQAAAQGAKWVDALQHALKHADTDTPLSLVVVRVLQKCPLLRYSWQNTPLHPSAWLQTLTSLYRRIKRNVFRLQTLVLKEAKQAIQNQDLKHARGLLDSLWFLSAWSPDILKRVS